MTILGAVFYLLALVAPSAVSVGFGGLLIGRVADSPRRRLARIWLGLWCLVSLIAIAFVAVAGRLVWVVSHGPNPPLSMVRPTVVMSILLAAHAAIGAVFVWTLPLGRATANSSS
ncbi:MAG TPA: hypothetical protein VF310_16480 [Vicinamibacteria bacterium]